MGCAVQVLVQGAQHQLFHTSPSSCPAVPGDTKQLKSPSFKVLPFSASDHPSICVQNLRKLRMPLMS